MQVQSLLIFNGKTEEALELYRTALGAEVIMMMRWKESPDADMRAASRAFRRTRASSPTHLNFHCRESTHYQ